MGWFQTADPLKVNLRSQKLNADFYKQWCRDAFGRDFWPNQWRTNNYWGGLAIDVDRLIMTNGSEVTHSTPLSLPRTRGSTPASSKPEGARSSPE